MSEAPVELMVVGTPPHTIIHATQGTDVLWLTPAQAVDLIDGLKALAPKVQAANEALS